MPRNKAQTGQPVKAPAGYFTVKSARGTPAYKSAARVERQAAFAKGSNNKDSTPMRQKETYPKTFR